MDSLIALAATKPQSKFVNLPTIPKQDVLGRIGSLETRLAATSSEIEAAQNLRYRVFVEEMGAQLPRDAMMLKRDFDHFDNVCDHLLVFDTERRGTSADQIVGTYRLMRQDKAEHHSGFYSQNEYDVANLTGRHPDKQFLELGRSCVLPEYRTRRSIELLWQGIWAYVCKHNIDAMFGCASFFGTIPAAHAQALSFLYHTSKTTAEWTVQAQTETAQTMDLMPIEAISMKEALLVMPPLIKGYLRVGAMIAPQAVVDHAFNTTDVMVVLPVSQISKRYIDYYSSNKPCLAS